MFGHSRKKLRVEEATKRIIRYCEYQERSEKEVFVKLKSYNLSTTSIHEVIQFLKEEGWVDNLRFAKAYAHGKFCHNRWGRNKIKTGLIGKGIPPDLILEALNEIPEDDYLKRVGELIERKRLETETLSPEMRREKVFNYIVQKGFEWDIVQKVYARLNG